MPFGQPELYAMPQLLSGILERLLKEELQDMLDPYSLEATNAVNTVLPERTVSDRNPIVRPGGILEPQARDLGSVRPPIVRQSPSTLAGITSPPREFPTLPNAQAIPRPPSPARGQSYNVLDLDGFIREIARQRLAPKTFGVAPQTPFGF